MASLFRLPYLTVTMGEKGEAELELSDDPFDCRRLDVTNVPCVVTLNKVCALSCFVLPECLSYTHVRDQF